MKKTVIFLFILTLLGCSQLDETKSKDMKFLSRIDIAFLNGEQRMILDNAVINQIRPMIQEIKWENQNNIPIRNKAAAQITLFYLFDKNMPERLETYVIWFKQTGAILYNQEEDLYGKLDQNQSNVLKNILEKKSVNGL
ncbi:hypothetical protein [Ornithinibacillus xuwenensis]|uniref:Lipoprotein n=1 Tax=Ornithinibacillus xuwenensis TaxID=3144668 RepID=A0ABU9XHK2_9BACI